MRDYRRGADEYKADVYMIMRVYNLGKSNIGLRILINPSLMEERKELVFDAQQYVVRQKSL